MTARSDEGFSLVEVLIAMFLLGVLSLAILPLIIGATRLTLDNRESVEATALADSHVAALRAQFPVQPATDTTCAQLRNAATLLVDNNAATLPNVVLPTGFTRNVAVETCPTGVAAGKPAGILVTIRVTAPDGDATVLRTRIPVTSA